MSIFNESNEKIEALLEKLKTELSSESRLKSELDTYIDGQVSQQYIDHANRFESLEKKEKEAQEDLDVLKKDLLAIKNDSLIKITEIQKHIQKVEAEAADRLKDAIEKLDAKDIEMQGGLNTLKDNLGSVDQKLSKSIKDNLQSIKKVEAEAADKLKDATQKLDAKDTEISGDLNDLKNDLHASKQELSNSIAGNLKSIQKLDIETTDRLKQAVEKLDAKDIEIHENLNTLRSELEKLVSKEDFEIYDSMFQKQNLKNRNLLIIIGIISIINMVVITVFLAMNYIV